MAHTKGEWTVETTKNGYRIQQGSDIICWEHNEGYDNLPDGKSNARLIASAPYLLEACKLAIKLVGRGESISNHKYKIIKGAINKAEGR